MGPSLPQSLLAWPAYPTDTYNTLSPTQHPPEM